MKIICPQHNGAIDVPDKEIKDASMSASHSIVCHCEICEEDILIENITIDVFPYTER